jgi:hypothetical protein
MTEKPFGFSSRGCVRTAIRSNTRPTVAGLADSQNHGFNELVEAAQELLRVTTTKLHGADTVRRSDTHALSLLRSKATEQVAEMATGRAPAERIVWCVAGRSSANAPLLRAQSHVTHGRGPLRSPLSALAMQPLAPSVLAISAHAGIRPVRLPSGWNQ